MNILITGGAGFIGSAFVRHLIRHTGHHAVIVDKLTYAGSLNNLAAVSGSPRYAFERADIADAAAMEKIFQKYQPDAVLHLAAESHVDRSIADAAAFLHTNVNGTHVLLETLRRHLDRRPHCRFHHVSTDEVFGDLPPDAPPAPEHTAYAPNNPYAASKAASDHLVRAWRRTYGIPAVFSHSSNNFSKRQFPEKFIPHLIGNALRGQPLPVYGDGTQSRDWLYADDHARALYAVLTRGRDGESYNIAGGNEYSNLWLAHTLCGLLERLAPDKPQGVARYADLIRHVADRPGHDRRYALDCGKIRRELGWRPQHRFGDALAKTAEWYVRAFQAA